MTLPKLESEPYEISIRFYCYDDRQSHWKDALPASTPLEVQIRSGILTASNDPASKYFQILFDQFLPAVQQKDDQKANSIIDTELAPLYTQHKAAIEQLADLTEKSQSLREQEAKQRIASRIILLITVIVLSLALMLGVGIYVIVSYHGSPAERGHGSATSGRPRSDIPLERRQ